MHPLQQVQKPVIGKTVVAEPVKKPLAQGMRNYISITQRVLPGNVAFAIKAVAVGKQLRQTANVAQGRIVFFGGIGQAGIGGFREGVYKRQNGR